MKYGKAFLDTKGLQIGNYVATNLGTNGDIEISSIVELYEFIVVCENEQESIKNLSIFNIRPIILTEYFLQEFGFILEPWGFVKGKFLLTKDFIFRVGNGYEKKINYVHELQNLYYALNDEVLVFDSV